MSDVSKSVALPAGCEPLITATLRTQPEDFVVHELLDLPDEECTSAAHLWVNVEKRERNTQDVASALAAAIECPVRDIGFAGLKDRRAITQQWFSLPVSSTASLGADPQAQLQERLPADACTQVLASQWRSRKLKRGAHAGNRFEITLREVGSDYGHDELAQRMAERVSLLRSSGFPNAFGPQRFGPGGRNLAGARRLFSRGGRLPRPKGQRQRHERGMWLSAARAHVFNRVLDTRLVDGSWRQALPGEPLMLAGSNSRFVPELIDETIRQRLHEGDLSTSGPLPGRGEDGTAEACRALESTVLEQEAELVAGLQAAGVDASRRALCAQAQDLECLQLDKSTWRVSVTLQTGVFATSLLQQFGACQDAA